jgi:UvrD-like helicase C-terminal domain
MVTRNDYERDVSNGDIGYVTGIDEDDQVLRLECDGRSLAYDWADTDDLVHAYAISIHKAQGSEYPAVVIPILTERAVMPYGCKSQIARQRLTKGSHPSTVGILVRKPTLARRLPRWKLTKKPIC